MKDIEYWQYLESESIHVIRESANFFQNPVILFSGGKDSIVLTHLAIKAFYPQDIPFKIVHVDTGHNFPETIKFRDEFVKKNNLKLIVGHVQEAIDEGKVKENINAKVPSRNVFQSVTLLDTIEKYKIDACLGGARRDEEKARAKERFFSVRNEFGEWDPKMQRPELWNIYNGRISSSENVRVFPLSNWTELDIWLYIKFKNIEVPNLYFSHQRDCFAFQNTFFSTSPHVNLSKEDQVVKKEVRFRTIGDMTCTAVVESSAYSIDMILEEIVSAKETERGSRVDDKVSKTAMEDRKKQGYF